MTHQHVVKRGDCISSIAFENGFFPDTLWQHPSNTSLREQRASPHVLLEGDLVHVPDKRQKTCTVSTGRSHSFHRRGVPSRVRLKILRNGRPRAGAPFTMELDGVPHRTGMTDASGYIDVYISPSAQRVRLLVGPDQDQVEYELALGHTDPATELTGVQQRLRNLGLYRGEIDGVMGEALAVALRQLQVTHELPATGELDDPTRAALVAAHGS
jgi:hypothetical protein